MRTRFNFALMLWAFLLLVCIDATVSDQEVNEASCGPPLCEGEGDCYTLQPQDAITDISFPTEGRCQPNPCHNGGACETTSDRGEIVLGYVCVCLPGFTGIHCQHNVNECDSEPCQNGGVCQDEAAQYTCVCPAEYYGPDCQHRCSGPIGMEGGTVSDDQLSSSSSDRTVWGLHRWLPQRARLHLPGLVNAWSPAESDLWPWIQVNLQQWMRITGVITQGARRLGRSEFVKTYRVAYGDDGKTWRMIKAKGSKEDMLFHGNTDSRSSMANAFSPPIEAEYIRIYPQLCWGHCTLRMELLGCDLTGCSELLGLRSGEVHDSQLSASTVHLTLGMELLSWRPEYARLGRRGKVNAWAAARNDQAQWLQVDLLTPTNISGVITQGAKDFGREQFVSSYKLTYSQDGRDWTTFQDEERHNDKVFQGNSDNKRAKKNAIKPPIHARFIRLVPWSWHGRITVRMELLICRGDE
ncbi:EGF-like repeat and discoidin I-like domain-containing protein 3 isoform X1 [Gadus morhua]|uniref:EGF like repeats and discoidin domains 3 n=1 Tax=Gadus morhua TaxID=8049 RepID=A0A8C5BKB9_GADMO|nr:EGF-like repeat and discoidin I-like domain-containing protein 3 isoform X1 [Gadus morhua]